MPFKLLNCQRFHAQGKKVVLTIAVFGGICFATLQILCAFIAFHMEIGKEVTRKHSARGKERPGWPGKAKRTGASGRYGSWLNRKGWRISLHKSAIHVASLACCLLLSGCFLLLDSCGSTSSQVKGSTPVPNPVTLQGDLHAHDPSMIKADGTYYVFSTGGGLQIRTSTDLIHWQYEGPVFDTIPAWISQAVGSDVTNLWAPDIAYHNGVYYLYYCGSVFGKNTSVIGLATNTTLDRTNPNYRWADQGLVIQSGLADDFNAIDPNLTFDASGQPWLTFGSFWSGIQLMKLDSRTFKLVNPTETRYNLASNYADSSAIEAPYLIYRDGYYYLFASIDFCCRGADSTYKTVVGRAREITGPYYNKDGTRMGEQANFTVLLMSEGNVVGPGGESIYRDNNTDVIIYHYYDANDGGAIKFLIKRLLWSKGWPGVDAQEYTG
jgi:arabinan endo-1,5-alpha-L-arabinosidase